MKKYLNSFCQEDKIKTLSLQNCKQLFYNWVLMKELEEIILSTREKIYLRE